MCTSIWLKINNQILLANNEDVPLESGMIFSNQRGLSKFALLQPSETPARWISRFGNLTFSQAGKEFPSAGMNEAGLVVEQMTLPETQYAPVDQRPAASGLQMIQMLLDTCATLSEGMECLAQNRVAESAERIHLMIADHSARLVIVEFLHGEMVVYEKNELPVPVCSNCSYKDSIAALSNSHESFSDLQDDYKKNALTRFVTAARCWQSAYLGSENPVALAFEMLDQVQQPNTMWKLVYDITERKISFRLKWSNHTHSVNLDSFDFTPESMPKVMDLTSEFPGGPVDSFFTDYNEEMNLKLVRSFFQNELMTQALGIQFLDEMVQLLAAYPQQFVMG